MVKIFVGNVASATTEAELRALFEQHGTVSDCDILKNYGFVHMDEEDAARKAVAALHKYVLNGSRITVEYATTKVRNATKIYVGNVPEGVTAAKIKELFQPFGKVVECDIVKNFAFVHMQRENEALEAIRELNHSKVEGQKIFVSLSRSNQAKNGRGEDFLPPPPIIIHPTHTTFPHALRLANTIHLEVVFHLLLSLHHLPVPTTSARFMRGVFDPTHMPLLRRVIMSGIPMTDVFILRSDRSLLRSPLATTVSAALWAAVAPFCLRHPHHLPLPATPAPTPAVAQAPHFLLLLLPPLRPPTISAIHLAQALIKMITWKTSTATALAEATKIFFVLKVDFPFCYVEVI